MIQYEDFKKTKIIPLADLQPIERKLYDRLKGAIKTMTPTITTINGMHMQIMFKRSTLQLQIGMLKIESEIFEGYHLTKFLNYVINQYRQLTEETTANS